MNLSLRLRICCRLPLATNARNDLQKRPGDQVTRAGQRSQLLTGTSRLGGAAVSIDQRKLTGNRITMVAANAHVVSHQGCDEQEAHTSTGTTLRDDQSHDRRRRGATTDQFSDP